MAWTDKLAQFLRLNDGEQAYTGYPQMQVGLNKPRQAGYATGFLEGATGMESMQPKNPITDSNYDQYAQGKNTGEAVGIGATAIPGYAMALKAGAPKAYNALENYMVKSGGMIPFEAYYGSPSKFTEFDVNAPKTTAGGFTPYGISASTDKSVAERYATDFSKGKGNLYKLDIDVNNPLNLKATEFEKLQHITSQLDAKKPLTESQQIDLELLFKSKGIDWNPNIFPLDAIKKAGYDALTKDAGKYGVAEAEHLIFDPKKIKILESMPVSRKAILEEQVSKLKE